jgi:hypothetical protein
MRFMLNTRRQSIKKITNQMISKVTYVEVLLLILKTLKINKQPKDLLLKMKNI